LLRISEIFRLSINASQKNSEKIIFYNIGTENPNWTQYESQRCEATKEYYRRRKQQEKLKLGLRNVLELLAELNDPLLSCTRNRTCESCDCQKFVRII